MSAQEQMRAMLDELMGTGRDGENNKYKVAFDDPRVCKSFLLSCCPHDILSSTGIVTQKNAEELTADQIRHAALMDLGDCPKIHDLALRADYDLASKGHDYYYDIDAMEHLQSFIVECDRKVELAKKRLKETQEELSEEANSKAEVIHQLGEQMGTKLSKAETSGAEGNVEESLTMMAEVEDLKKRKSMAENDYRNSMPASSYQQQKLRVCEVCSAYLGIHDNDRRLADHFGGKLHLGFITIREKLDDLKKSVADRRAEREKEREETRRGRREEDEKKNSPSAGRTKSRSRSRDRRRRSRSKSRSKNRRSRSRDRHSRKRSRRSRSKSRSRDRRRSRERSRRSRSRSRSKKQSRSRRSRSRSRSRRSRSRSRQDKKTNTHSKSPQESKTSPAPELKQETEGNGTTEETAC